MKLVTNEMKRKKTEKKKNAEFMNNERNIQLTKENNILLGKLVEISSGKFAVSKREKSVQAPTMRSLNTGYRRKEHDKIEQENHAFAQRLYAKKSNFDKKRMDEEFKEHKTYKKHIMKLQPMKNGKKDSNVKQSHSQALLEQVAHEEEG